MVAHHDPTDERAVDEECYGAGDHRSSFDGRVSRILGENCQTESRQRDRRRSSE